MRITLYKSISIVFQILFFACLMIMTSICFSQSPQTSGQPDDRNDLRRFLWLSHLTTTKSLLFDLDDKDSKVRENALSSLTEGMSEEEKVKVRAFIQELKDKQVFKSLVDLEGYICKRKPCPPPIKPQDHILLIRTFREPALRADLFSSKTVDKSLEQFQSLTPSDVNAWKQFFSYPANKKLIEDVASVLCQERFWPCK